MVLQLKRSLWAVTALAALAAAGAARAEKVATTEATPATPSAPTTPATEVEPGRAAVVDPKAGHAVERGDENTAEPTGAHHKAGGHKAAREGAAHEAGTEGKEEGHQFLDFRVSEAMWVVILFVVLLAVLYPTAWKNVRAGLDAREQRIRKDIADAEASRLRAEKALQQYNAQLTSAEQKVREILETGRADAARLAEQMKKEAEESANATRERALKEIEEARKQALSQIYEQTADLATSVAAKILRRNLNADDQRDLVSQSLDQLQGAGRM